MLFNYKQPPGLEIPTIVQEQVDHIYKIIIDILMPKLNFDTESAKTTCSVLWAGLHGICLLTMGGKMGFFSLKTANELGNSFVTGYLKGTIA